MCCSWLRDKHNKGLIESLFWPRAEYRIHLAVHNPIFIPSRMPSEGKSGNLPPEIQFTANEAQAKMLAIEKCDIVVMNPLFGSGLPYNPKVGQESAIWDGVVASKIRAFWNVLFFALVL